MKKTVLSIFSAFLTLSIHAQIANCLPDYNFDDEPDLVDNWFSPNPAFGESFQVAVVGEPYSETMHMKVPALVNVDGVGPVPIDSIRFDSVSFNLADTSYTAAQMGLVFQCNNNDDSSDTCTFHAGNQYCATLTGTPTTPGMFGFTINYTVFVFFVGQVLEIPLLNQITLAVCEFVDQDGEPIAAFSPIISGTSVSFQNNSESATNYDWDFGDGSTSSLSSPIHTFGPGTYMIQLISSNICGADTADAFVELGGLNNFNPKIGGNTGEVTIELHGYGFDENTDVRLVRPGFTDIGTVGGFIAVEDLSSATVTFDLSGQAVGPWSLEVEFQSLNTTVTASEPFIIEDGDESYNLSVSFVGSPVIRGSGTYILRITNSTNIDASLVPVEVSISDTLGSISIPQGTAEHDLPEDILDPEPSTFAYSLDEGLSYRRYYFFYSRLIPANTSIDVPVIVEMPVGSSGEVEAVIGDPLELDPVIFEELVDELIGLQDMEFSSINEIIDYFDESRSSGCAFKDQDLRALKQVASGLTYTSLTAGILAAAGVTAMAPVAIAIGAAATLASAANWYLQTRQATLSGDISKAPSFIDSATLLAGGIKTTFNLAGGAAKAVGKNLPVGTVARRSGEIVEDVGTGNTVASDLFGPSSTTGCNSPEGGDDQLNGAASSQTVSSVGSWDPNEKYGPLGVDGAPFHNGRSALYSVYFENVDTATAPAQTVVVRDTLDLTVYDPSSYRTVAIGLADSLHVVPADRYGNYFVDLNYEFLDDLFVRVNITLDTLTGELVMHFISLEDNTGEFVSDPLGGFLPPNENAPEGEGFVVFEIGLHDHVGSGVEIGNEAAIYFDDNEPIITNLWTYTTDFDKPSAQIVLPNDTVNSQSANIQWTGTDPTSSVAYYDVFFRTSLTNEWTKWKHRTNSTEEEFVGNWGENYWFAVKPLDFAGNPGDFSFDTTQYVVMWPIDLTLMIDIAPVSCADSSDAQIAVSPVGGVPPYTYLWSTGDEDALLDSLIAGVYSLTVTDALGATIDTAFTITNPLPLNVQVSAFPMSCEYNLNSGFCVADVTGGMEPYSFTWGPFEWNNSISNVESGMYTAIVEDSRGCKRIDSADYVAPNPITTAPIIEPITCTGAADGSIDLNASGGFGDIFVDWEGIDPEVLPPGYHTFTITDQNNCTFVDSILIEEPEPIGISPDINDISCFAAADGSVALNISGGTGDISVSWADDVNPLALVFGYHVFEISDANSCTLVDSIFINEPEPIEVDIATTSISCFGESDGAIDLSATGGTGELNIEWENGIDLPQDLTAGTYEYLITDENECTISGTVELEEPEELSIQFVETVFPGGDEECDGSITIEITGGSGEYEIVWDTLSTDSTTITGLCPGIYSISVTDENGCFASESYLLDATNITSGTNEYGLMVFPNPTKGRATVVVNSAQHLIQEAELYSLSGARIRLENINAPVDRFDIDFNNSNLPAATYLLRLRISDDWVSLRVSFVR